MFCSPPIIEKEWKVLHRSGVQDLINDSDDQSTDQPSDAAYVFNGTITMRSLKYSLIHKDEILNIISDLVSDGWTVEGDLSMSPLIQGSDYYSVSVVVKRAEGIT